MQGGVDALRQFGTDSWQLSQVLQGGGLHAAQAAEMAQDPAAAFGTQTGHFFEDRRPAHAAPALAVPLKGKPMSFVAYARNQLERR